MGAIDFHLHVAPPGNFTPWVQEYFRSNNPGFFGLFAGGVDRGKLVAYLDSQGVEKAVLLSEYAPLTSGLIPNEFTADLCRGSDRLVPFGAVDLDAHETPEAQLERAVGSLGMRGMKMLPSYARYWPADPRLMPFYGLAQEMGIPVMFHTGSSLFKGSRIKYADPLLLDEIADEFPRLVIVMSHGGRPFWYDRARWMLARHENVHIDIAGMPTRKLPALFPGMEARSDRFIFGSDWPGTGDIRPAIVAVKSLGLAAGAEERILRGNAARLLGA